MNKEGFVKDTKVYVLEGPDGSGKSTTIKNLKNMFAKDDIMGNEKIIYLRDQTVHSEVTIKLRELMHNYYDQLDPKTFLMLQLASRVELNKIIDKYKFIKGHIIILDRYFPSTLVYQGKHFDRKYIKDLMNMVYGKDLYDNCDKIYVLCNDKPFKDTKDDTIEEGFNYDEIMSQYQDLMLTEFEDMRNSKYVPIDTSDPEFVNELFNDIKMDTIVQNSVCSIFN